MLLDAHRTLKIADFGVARVEAQNPRDMTGETGTLGYMAPEVPLACMITLKIYFFGVIPWTFSAIFADDVFPVGFRKRSSNHMHS